MALTKKELVEKLAEKVDLPKKTLSEVLTAVDELIVELLQAGEKFKVAHVTFEVVDVPPRKVRNPRTGEVKEVPATKKVKVKKDATLKKLFK